MSSFAKAIAETRALPCWNSPQPGIEQLGGGITNINLKVTDGERAYVVRFGQDIPEHGVMRFNELAISQAAASIGIAPAIRYSQPGVLVLDFVEAPALEATDLHDAKTLEQVTKLIRRTHRELTPVLRGPVLSFWVFHVLRNYAGFLRQSGSPHCGALDALMTQAGMLEKAVGPVQLVLGHNDLLPANILRANKQVWLIDWEYGGFNSPLFDLGGLATNCDLPPEAEQLMLQSYFGTAPDAALMQSYGAMKCASLLRETMWSMVSEITSEIDFDYATYSADNLVRYQQALSDYQSQRGTS